MQKKTREAEKQSEHMKKLADAATTKLETVLLQLQVLVANSGFPHITQLVQDPIKNHISLITAFGSNTCQALQVGGRARACLVCKVSGPGGLLTTQVRRRSPACATWNCLQGYLEACSARPIGTLPFDSKTLAVDLAKIKKDIAFATSMLSTLARVRQERTG